MASTSSNALTTPSVWDISRIDESALQTAEDLHIVLKSVFPQANIEVSEAYHLIKYISLILNEFQIIS